MEYLTGIIFTNKIEGGKPVTFKYRNIGRTRSRVNKFMRFAKSKGGVHVNFYCKLSRRFLKQLKIDETI